ncbi:MAG: BON domain-containing protein [Planctomycetota bacterium]|nr:MAG: BON domain-containing protein [Planctomycetota bacterium]REK47465.1 MAG: BON domain-containing protein [Planctomycetota bacterium]
MSSVSLLWHVGDGRGRYRTTFRGWSWPVPVLRIFAAAVCVAAIVSTTTQNRASAQPNGSGVQPASPERADLSVPEEVEIKPAAEDNDIAKRLTEILQAKGWFEDPTVRTDEGVVFLAGRVDNEEHREWAGRLASRTEDVVAVVNRLEVRAPSPWDLSPAWQELGQLCGEFVRTLPLIAVGVGLLVATWLAAKWSVRGASFLLKDRLRSGLLRSVVARAVAVPVFLLGLYLVLKVSGLTGLAATVIGGTGIVGLVLGFAFRDIAENFLASILISMQHPFATDDLIEVDGHKGFVQSVNTRSTLLMTLDGNHVQIPNATIYKNTITNYTANPNARFDFVVGIGYDDSITNAQSIVLSILQEHPAVVDDPEPLVLVENLGAATVNLRIYFWMNIAKYSQFKVCSAVIRQVKSALEEANISMPDEAREVVFPDGVPVRKVEHADNGSTWRERPVERAGDRIPTSRSGEGDLTSESHDIREQARVSRTPEGGSNLLEV